MKRQLTLLALCLVLLGCGCATIGIDRTMIEADQARRDAVQAPIERYVAAHPQQAQSWRDFLAAWDDSLRARRVAIGIERPAPAPLREGGGR